MLITRCSVRRRQRSGAVAVFVAVCLSVLLAVVAIALDGGILLSERRHAQAAADAAALSAAADLYLGRSVQTAEQSALTTLAANGYANDGVTSIITPNVGDPNGNPVHGIWIPPISGDHVGDPNYAEVVVQWNQSRGFSNIFASGRIPVSARAAAGIVLKNGTNAGILLLNPSAQAALNVTGNGNVIVKSGMIIVDSNNSQAAIITGTGSVKTSQVDITGSNPGYESTGNGWFDTSPTSGNIKTGQAPTPDPLTSLPPPDPSSLPIKSSHQLNLGRDTVLQPGRYIGGISLSGPGSLTLLPGIYYLDGGGFSATGQGSITGTGVMLYNAPRSGGDTISITGQGSVTITPPASGTYQGISIFQDRTSTAPLSVTGNGNFKMTGAFYAAKASLRVTGNGSNDVIGSQYISDTLTVTGNGSFNVDWAGSPLPAKRSVVLVE